MPKYNLNTILQYGEGQFVEFKESLDKSLSKEIVAFANASGGVIYLGISDSAVIKGVAVTNKLKSQIQDTARNCDPTIIISLEEQNNVLFIKINEGINKPYSCSSGFYMRMGANSQKMKRDEIIGLAIKSGKIRFDEQICSKFDWKDFDNDKFEYYLKLAGISNNLPKEEILKNLHVLTDDGFTNAGVLYFAKNPDKYIISSKIRCIHFYGDKRIDILDKKVIDRGIISNIEFAIEYLKERVPVRYEIKDIRRKEFPEYPIKAYRESIVNAIIHFDYFLGDTIAIEKLRSRIVINNKGELLFPKKDFGNKSEARNRLLVDLLSRTDFMEKAGTGIQRVKDACLTNGNKISFDFSDSFWVTIESNKVTDKVTDKLTDNQLKIIDIININNYVTTKKISEEINISQRKVKENIAKLKKKNLLKRFGNSKSGHWIIIENDKH